MVGLVIPCWRDGKNLRDLLPALVGCNVLQHVVVASAPGDDANIWVRDLKKVQVISCPKLGRGNQIREGIRHLTTEIVGIVHADADFREKHLIALSNVPPHCGGGGFVRAWDHRHPRLRWLEHIEKRLCAAGHTPIWGDQAPWARRSILDQIGFPDQPLLEDVAFSQRLRHVTTTCLLDPPLLSSARNFQSHSWKSSLRNLGILLAYESGVSPQTLHRWYYSHRASPTGKE